MAVVRRLGQGTAGPARVVALGCGGAGCNILRRLRHSENLVAIALNDAPHPAMLGTASRILVDRGTIRAVAGVDAAVAKDLAAAPDKAIAAAIEGATFVALFAGLGGDVGGWAATVVARVAGDHGIPSIALVATPFASEGLVRRRAAEEQLAALGKAADGVVEFANDALLRMAPKLPLARALGALGAILVRPVEDVARVARADEGPALLDTWRAARVWRYGAGEGREKHGAYLAIDEALSSPWFTRSPEDASAAVAVVTVAPGTPGDESTGELRKRLPRAALLAGIIEDSTREADRRTVSVTVGWS